MKPGPPREGDAEQRAKQAGSGPNIVPAGKRALLLIGNLVSSVHVKPEIPNIQEEHRGTR
jgi:hypothetical protein